MSRFSFSESILAQARAIQKRKDYGELKIYAEKIGCGYNNLSVTLSNQKAGTRKGAREKTQRRLAHAEEFFRLGGRPSELIKPFGVKNRDAIYMFLLRHGLDLEEQWRLRNDELIETGHAPLPLPERLRKKGIRA